MDLAYYQRYWGYLWTIPKGLNDNFDRTMDIIEQAIIEHSSKIIVPTEYSQIVETRTEQFKIISLLDLASYICIGIGTDPALTTVLMDASFIAKLGQKLQESLTILHTLNDVSVPLLFQLGLIECRCDDIRLFVNNYFLETQNSSDNLSTHINDNLPIYDSDSLPIYDSDNLLIADID